MTRPSSPGEEIPGAGVLGMAIFLAALSVLFIASIVGYLIVRLKATAWPPPGMPRLPGGLWVATVVILAASATIHLAFKAIKLGNARASARWLWTTFALGVGFLIVQGINWGKLVSADVGLKTKNLYAFTFYMLTGLHAAHVVGGLILLGIVALRATRGRYGSGRHGGVTYATMYWHFLDVVWLVLFGVLKGFA